MRSSERFLLAILVTACASRPATFDAAKLREIDGAVESAIAARQLPGGVIWIERDGNAYHRSYGHRALVPRRERMSEDTIFDAASLTKVVATAPAIWLLIERRKLEIDAPVSRYLPEFRGGWRDEVTIRHLLTHTSGLRPDLDLDQPWSGYDTAIGLVLREMPQNRPGYVFRGVLMRQRLRNDGSRTCCISDGLKPVTTPALVPAASIGVATGFSPSAPRM